MLPSAAFLVSCPKTCPNTTKEAQADTQLVNSLKCGYKYTPYEVNTAVYHIRVYNLQTDFPKGN